MKPYLKYLFEVLAIVVGITLSFVVDEWREERQKKREEIQSLEKLLGGAAGRLYQIYKYE